MPGAADELLKYALDVKNPLDYRVAAFHVLRYIDAAKFDIAAKRFDTELASANSDIKLFIKAVEAGTSDFDGIFPLSSTHDRPSEQDQ